MKETTKCRDLRLLERPNEEKRSRLEIISEDRSTSLSNYNITMFCSYDIIHFIAMPILMPFVKRSDVSQVIISFP